MTNKTKTTNLSFIKIIIAILLLFSAYVGIMGIRFSKNPIPLAKAEEESTSEPIEGVACFEYLHEQESLYREENPTASEETVTAYMENIAVHFENIEDPNEENTFDEQTYSNYRDDNGNYLIVGKTIRPAELELIFRYPIQAYRAYTASNAADDKESDFYYISKNRHLTNIDAFRHAYWNALMVRKLNSWSNAPKYSLEYWEDQVALAKRFADAHEDDASGIDLAMDLFNNDLGRQDGVTFAHLSEHEMAEEIVKRISYGHYRKIINEVEVNGKIESGNLVPTDSVDLLPTYFDKFMFDTTILSDDEICLNGLNWEVSGIYTVPTTIKNRTVVSLGSYVLENQTAITGIVMQEGMKHIGANAFANYSHLTSVVLPSSLQSIGSFAFQNCNALTEIAIPSSVISIGEGAFAGCNHLNVSVAADNPNYSSTENILYNKAGTCIVATGEISSNSIFPSTITEIASFAFFNNSNLHSIRFVGSPSLGNYAFANCQNLSIAHFDNSATPTVGTGVFENDACSIFVPYYAQAEYKEAFISYEDNVDSIILPITLVNGTDVNSYTLYDGSTLDVLTTPIRAGYTFGGWYDNTNYTGTPYQNGILLERETALTLYAKWTPNEYVITLNPNGGVLSGENTMSVLYDHDFSTFTIVEREGYFFEGWYDNNGVKYLTTQGQCTRLWDKVEDTVLTAHWTIERYQIRVNDNGTVIWLSENGWTDTESSIPYGATIAAIDLVPTFKASVLSYREGRIFDHFVYENPSEWNWSSVPDFGTNGVILDIVPVWIKEVHGIYFATLCELVTPSIIEEYDTTITLPELTRLGYEFEGWATQLNSQAITWRTMPDLTPNTQSNGSIQLYAKWTPKVYTFVFYNNGAAGTMSPIVYTYDMENSPSLTCTFQKQYYECIGWATSPNGEVEIDNGARIEDIIDLSLPSDTTISLYAVWQPQKFNILYQNTTFKGQAAQVVMQNSSSNVAPTQFEYGVGVDLTNVVAYSAYDAQLQFLGWYRDAQFNNQALFISTSEHTDVVLYAKWRYDFNQIHRTNRYLITDADPYSEDYQDNVLINLSSNNSELYNNLKAIGIQYLTIEFKIKMFEISDGYQEILIYNDKNTLLWDATEIEHDPTDANSTPQWYIWRVELNIDLLKNSNYLYVRYGAHGKKNDTWVAQELWMDIMYTANLGDDSESIVDFYWADNDVIDDEDCIPLESVSEL